ncbi:MAG TPA: DNA polymerase domain-containing protein [Nitrososphaerales archaeon]|nr:DNA polymerase domain-containing protein [Nitrososphaerales archaeon]
MTIRGWLLDCYPSKRGMTFWIINESGSTVKLHDSTWRNRIYAYGEAADSPNFLQSRLAKTPVSQLVSSVKFAYKRADLLREGVQKVIQIELSQADKARQVAEALENIFQNPLTFKLYNVDLLPEQTYFCEKNIFPLGFVQVETSGDQITRWELKDDVESTDYRIPDLRVLSLDATISSKVPRFDSRLTGVTLHDSKDLIRFEGQREEEIIEKARNEIIRQDPDIITTRNGDLFALPFLYQKAQRLNLDFNLNRDSEMRPSHLISSPGSGSTFFSYGRILFKAKMQKLYGRIHLDEANTFVFDQCRFAGLFEITRACRMPLQNSVRASIGKCLSGIQFYHAAQKDILIPWKPWIAEDPKTFHELLNQDRGGLVLEPLPGVHEHVGEVDFASLYPSIIRKYNISAETLNCSCCIESGHRIEGLDLHICKLQKGIVAESLKLPLEKRFKYRDLRDNTNDESLKQTYNERAGALKWVLVTSFGYLSYRNAKFGKIDSHIAVCGYARKTLLQAMRTAEENGCRVIHGIVDSLWLSKPGATRDDYLELCDRIKESTGFKIVLEGIYKWIVFLPSKTDAVNQVANRYFGCFEENNEMKVRGVEYRRGDTPVYFKLCQKQIFDALSKCDNAEELRRTASTEGVQIFHDFANRLEKHDVSPIELLITKRLSKNLEEYRFGRQLSVSATSKLVEQGLKLQAGQSVSYVISNYRTSGRNRAIPEELAENARYDSRRYVELLADCCATLLSPLGVQKSLLLSRSETLFARSC